MFPVTGPGNFSSILNIFLIVNFLQHQSKISFDRKCYKVVFDDLELICPNFEKYSPADGQFLFIQKISFKYLERSKALSVSLLVVSDKNIYKPTKGQIQPYLILITQTVQTSKTEVFIIQISHKPSFSRG